MMIAVDFGKDRLRGRVVAGLAATLAVVLANAARPAVGDEQATETRIAIDDAHLYLSPYVWKCSGAGPQVRAEAAMPGAYLRAVFQNSTTIGVLIDGTANTGCPAASMPVVEYSLDQGPFKTVPLTKTGELYTLPVANHLDATSRHHLEFFFRAADLGQRRWTSSQGHLRLAGIALSRCGSVAECGKRSKRAIGFGDSITEGVGVDGLFTSWQLLGVNNARATWLPIACVALDCEYGQLGSGGQGILNAKLEMPPLPQSWDHYDPATSRLTNHRLLPEPDYVFCAMGTNDFGPEFGQSQPFIEAYTRWLTAVRRRLSQCSNLLHHAAIGHACRRRPRRRRSAEPSGRRAGLSD